MAGNITRMGDLSNQPYPAGDMVTYTCAAGFTLVGKNISMCQSSSFTWTLMGADIPTCFQGNVRSITRYFEFILVCKNLYNTFFRKNKKYYYGYFNFK